MKQFKFLLFAIAAIALTSCNDTAEIEKTIVVEKVETNNKSNHNCGNCPESKYDYKIRIKSESGDVYYYTNFKHEVGDTLISIFEFKDNGNKAVKNKQHELDSIVDLNSKLQKKNEELQIYNELLIGIIKDKSVK